VCLALSQRASPVPQAPHPSLYPKHQQQLYIHNETSLPLVRLAGMEAKEAPFGLVLHGEVSVFILSLPPAGIEDLWSPECHTVMPQAKP
jgi:hypothetical protein